MSLLGAPASEPFTHEELLAGSVVKAALALNAAMREATVAGVTVEVQILPGVTRSFPSDLPTPPEHAPEVIVLCVKREVLRAIWVTEPDGE